MFGLGAAGADNAGQNISHSKKQAELDQIYTARAADRSDTDIRQMHERVRKEWWSIPDCHQNCLGKWPSAYSDRMGSYYQTKFWFRDNLNAKGIRTSRGNRFNKSTLRPMLSNVKYIGTYKYKDVVIENAFPAIVDKALFDRVQVRLKASLQHRQAYRKKVVYMLSGKIFCNKCGAPYIADAGTSKSGKVYNYYVCEDKKKRKNCKNRTYSKDILDNIVIKTTLKYVLTADRIEKIADNLIRVNEKRNESPYLSKLICDKAESEKKINNILSAIEKGIFTPSTKERLLALETEVKNLEAAITEENIKKPPLTKEAVLWFLNRLKKLNYSDEQCKDQLVKTLIHSVLIDDDRVIINYNYTNNDGITAFAECSSDSKMVETRGLEPLTF